MELKQLTKKIDEIYDQVVSFRRRLHMEPELSEQEVNTRKAIEEQLAALGIEFTGGVAGHCVIGTVYGQNRSHGVGIRADIDALPITEMTDVPFKSKIPGVMHACGHDVHTAILLGTAKILNDMKDSLKGSVRLIFQPAEETIGGAKRMIEAGCLQNPEIASVIGLHVESSVDAGSVQFIPGAMNAASCEFCVTVTGKSCHGAHPAEGIDPLPPACAMVSAIQAIVTRKFDPVDPVLITVGQFSSGTKNNVIPDEAKFSGIIRALNMSNMDTLKENLRLVCENTASAYGCTCKVELEDSYPSLENDGQLTELLIDEFRRALGDERVDVHPKASLGADDFSYFCHGARGLYYNLGVRRPGEKEAYAIHSSYFEPDEECIKIGILTEVLAVLRIMEEESLTWQ